MMRLCPKDGIKTEQERCPDCGTGTLVLAQNPDSKLAEGTEVNGRYRIDKIIGQGGFGAVYRATHLATDQEMAIKVLGVSLDSDESDLIQRFFAEAQITAGLKHPNTIRVFDFGQTEGGALYIAMELLSGNDLNELLKERKSNGEALSEEETIRITAQTLRSLAEAHMAGLVHRDLKPHNIFLNEVPGDDPVVKVLDFGIAKRLGSNLTGTGQAFGTPNYMSPEQAQNRPIDARSDLYSLGVVMYQCVAMRCPFEGDNPLAVLLSHVTDAPPPLSETAQVPLSDGFVQIVEKALAKDPFERFESAIEMRKALQAIGSAARRDTIAAGLAEAEELKKAVQNAAATTDDESPAAQELPDAATQAYSADRVQAAVSQYNAQQVSTATSEASSAPAAVGEDAAVTMDGSGSGFTEAFMGLGEVIQAEAASAKPAVEDPVEVAVQGKSAKGVMLLIGLVLLCAVGIGLVLTGGADEGEAQQAKPAAVGAEMVPGQASGESAETQQGAAAAPGNAGEGAVKAEDKPAQATVTDKVEKQQQDAGAADDASASVGLSVTAVQLTTDPQGAEVEVNGAILGKTPLELKVETNKPLTGHLIRQGYHKRDFFVMHTDAPTKQYKLIKIAPRPVAARPRRPKPVAPARPKAVKPPKPTKPAKKTPSALEERL